MTTPQTSLPPVQTSPSEPFLAQVQRLEEKLRRAQDGTDHDEQISAASEAADVRSVLQRTLIQKSEGLSRENEDLSQRVATLDRSLRASEALRKREAAQREDEASQLKLQLDSERRERRRMAEDGEAPATVETGLVAVGPPDSNLAGGSGGSMRSREWRLRACLLYTSPSPRDS